MRVLGVDEAGRGCVLGALVVGAFVIEGVDDDTLRAAGADDSKRLTPARRDAARVALRAHGQEDLAEIVPRVIDQGNLNTLEEDAIVALVRRWRPDRVYMDALGHPRTLEATRQRLLAAVHDVLPDLAWTIAPKADATWPVVGAASIVAKTHRDALLAQIEASHGPLGSGYPSDPVTRRWLAAWARTGRPWPDFVRTKWRTITDLSQPGLFPVQPDPSA